DSRFDPAGRGANIPATNGNTAVTAQLPSAVREPRPGESETGRDYAADDGRQVEAASARPKGGSRRRLLFAVIGLVLVGGTVAGIRHWLHSRQYESTDDAFIEGRATQISPKVSGYAVKLYIAD